MTFEINTVRELHYNIEHSVIGQKARAGRGLLQSKRPSPCITLMIMIIHPINNVWW